jgi:hypothetical protein
MLHRLFGAANLATGLTTRVVTLFAVAAVAVGFALAADRSEIVVNDIRS